MSQTLPDLVVSPCPVREQKAAFYLRSNLLCCLNRRAGFSWHPTLFDMAVIYWRRYLDFDDDPRIAELDECAMCPLLSEDQFDNVDKVASLSDRLPQAPRAGESGFMAIATSDMVASSAPGGWSTRVSARGDRYSSAPTR